MSQASLAQCVMVLGTTSGAGKSWLTTALCRYYARQGLRVAPFKAQNMSNNARVVEAIPPTFRRLRGSLGADGQFSSMGEIGSAQYFQALAAGVEPDVRMNPLLLKPEADTRSQVVLMGQVSQELSQMPWRGRSERVWPHICEALDDLRRSFDVVVIEGAGSPAEINLHESDIVNMRVARHAHASCLLVTDIDRGGAFAHLYGTWALLPDDEQALIKGFVFNKFRGDAELLAPGPDMLEARTGIPLVATLPMWWHHGLPEEDGVFDDRTRVAGEVRTTVAVVAYPRISNLDEFQPLKNVNGLRLVWARTPADCAAADWIILPGSKHTSADLAWLRAQGLDAAIASHARAGRRVLGICGGLQMLGEALIDTHGVDGNAPGLGLLPLVTAFAAAKTVRKASICFGDMHGEWAALSGVTASGYEIHHGETQAHPAMIAAGEQVFSSVPELAWHNGAGNVMGIYVHGLFEDERVMRALFGDRAQIMDQVFEGLADFVGEHFRPGFLDALVRQGNPSTPGDEPQGKKDK
ncbi:cobyric acid synthase [Hydrogenophaga sp. 5NK40-0174]|uniref:cobyric acid synthase n=1 Tax=Hydrogenophaga sp. 5NK40-0174 TaxID=3127649 RepID=UPI0031027EB0